MRLFINIDHVATVRQARGTDEPDPVRAAVLVELAGADGLTVHLREDRRHINDRDVELLLKTARTGVNLELAAGTDVVALALEWRPLQVTLVPEKREEITTEGGLALGDSAVLDVTRAAVERFRSAGIRTSLFIDPEDEMVEASVALQVEAVELHTGEYANAGGATAATEELDRLRRAAHFGRAAGLAIHAGHGLTYENVTPVAAISEIEELNIGHSVVSRAIFVGMERAVRDMAQLIQATRSQS